MSFTNKTFKMRLGKSEAVMIIITALLTAIAGEVKVFPFSGEVFRLGLGLIVFFLLILIRTPASLIRTGFITGITVVCFRVLGDIMIDDVPLTTGLRYHLPTFWFYFLFALGLSVVKIEKYKTSPILLGAFATVFEFIGNSAEYLTRNWLLNIDSLGVREWTLFAGVAVLRSFFAIGLYSSIAISEQKKRMQEMLEVGSELYVETLYLQKSMDHIEQITASSHDLYRTLKKRDLDELSVKALRIAQEIHEVKKDSQRVLAGLTKITVQKKDADLYLSNVLSFVVTANEKYSELLNKNIAFHFATSIDFETDQQIPLLALLNNLTANAVESIVENGKIELTISEQSGQICFVIKDSGKGISEGDAPIIYEPGYTTKFNDQGVAATGIGLSHVIEIISSLEGQIQMDSSAEGTVFQIQIPAHTIRK